MPFLKETDVKWGLRTRTFSTEKWKSSHKVMSYDTSRLRKHHLPLKPFKTTSPHLSPNQHRLQWVLRVSVFHEFVFLVCLFMNSVLILFSKAQYPPNQSQEKDDVAEENDKNGYILPVSSPTNQKHDY